MEGKKPKTKSKKAEIKKSKRVDLHVKVKKVEPKEKESQFDKNVEVAKKVEAHYTVPSKIEQDRITLMWGGAIFFMAVIFICWVAIFKNSFGGLASLPGKNSLDLKPINKVMEEFSDSFSSTTKQIADTLASSSAQSSSTAEIIGNLPTNLDTATGTVDINQSDVNKIKEEIIKLENKND